MPNQRAKNITDYKVRMPRELYAAVSETAKARGISVNAMLCQAAAVSAGWYGSDMLTRFQAARMLGISEWGFRLMRRQGQVQPLERMGSRWPKYRRQDLLGLMAGCNSHVGQSAEPAQDARIARG